jgi:hypothetical protein
VVERDLGEQVHIHPEAELDEEGDQQGESPAPRGAIPATGAASSFVAAGSLLLASAIAHLRRIAPVKFVMAAP